MRSAARTMPSRISRLESRTGPLVHHVSHENGAHEVDERDDHERDERRRPSGECGRTNGQSRRRRRSVIGFSDGSPLREKLLSTRSVRSWPRFAALATSPDGGLVLATALMTPALRAAGGGNDGFVFELARHPAALRRTPRRCRLLAYELGVRPLLDDAPLVEDDDPVARATRRRSRCVTSTTVRREGLALDRAEDGALGLRVHGARADRPGSRIFGSHTRARASAMRCF